MNLLAAKWISEVISIQIFSDSTFVSLSYLTGSAMYVTPEGVKTVDYLAVITKIHSRFIFRAPPLTYTSNIYYLPFTGVVWVCCVVISIVCTLFIYVSYQSRGVLEKHFAEGMSNGLIICAGIVCQIGAEFNPRRLSTRMAIVEQFIRTLCSNHFNQLNFRCSSAWLSSSFIRLTPRTSSHSYNQLRTQ